MSLFLFSVTSFSLEKTSLKQTVCDHIIPFANSNGSKVSEEDLYHCHTVLQLKEGEEKNYSNERIWSYLQDRKWGMICHAHEKDGERKTDNFNIFYKNGITSFWGEKYPIKEEDILKKYSLPEPRYLVTWTNIYFYPSDSIYCPLLRDSTAMSCNEIDVCIGLESDEHN